MNPSSERRETIYCLKSLRNLNNSNCKGNANAESVPGFNTSISFMHNAYGVEDFAATTYSIIPKKIRFWRNFQGNTGSRLLPSREVDLSQAKKRNHKTPEILSDAMTNADDHAYAMPTSCSAQTSRTDAVSSSRAPEMSIRCRDRREIDLTLPG